MQQMQNMHLRGRAMGHANAAQCFEGFDACNVPTRADAVHEQGIDDMRCPGEWQQEAREA
jgi:hypothetical protein